MEKYRWIYGSTVLPTFYSRSLSMALDGLHCGVQAFARRYGGIFNEAGSVRARFERLVVVLCILIRVEFLNRTKNGFHKSVRLQLLCVRLATGFLFWPRSDVGGNLASHTGTMWGAHSDWPISHHTSNFRSSAQSLHELSHSLPIGSLRDLESRGGTRYFVNASSLNLSFSRPF